jgi:hypothetical protein
VAAAAASLVRTQKWVPSVRAEGRTKPLLIERVSPTRWVTIVSRGVPRNARVGVRWRCASPRPVWYSRCTPVSARLCVVEAVSVHLFGSVCAVPPQHDRIMHGDVVDSDLMPPCPVPASGATLCFAQRRQYRIWIRGRIPIVT